MLFNRFPLHAQVNQIAGDFTSILLLEVDHREPATTFKTRLKALQQQLWRDLDQSIYSGIEVIRDLKNHHKLEPWQTVMPMVFTCMLGLQSQVASSTSARTLSSLGDLFVSNSYSISQTPQVGLDFQAYEIDGELQIIFDYLLSAFILLPPHSSTHSSSITFLPDCLKRV